MVHTPAHWYGFTRACAVELFARNFRYIYLINSRNILESKVVCVPVRRAGARLSRAYICVRQVVLSVNRMCLTPSRGARAARRA